MNSSISPNTEAILLLTAPLITGRERYTSNLLTHQEYNQLAKFLQDNNREPADLLGYGAEQLIKDLQGVFDSERLTHLLGRGFLLTQALEKWYARAIWVFSRADPEYPKRLKTRLRSGAPAILYGCGNHKILKTGGIAIIGSRKVDDKLIQYTENVSHVAAQAHQTVISGGAKGIDQAAIRGVLEQGGRAVGVLADSLSRLAIVREHRNYLMDDQLVLVSSFDPGAGFNVANAMSRNKMIYALSDAALVVSSNYRKGGTWAGAVEQLEKLHFVPIYVRSNGDVEKGLRALREKGALPWTDPQTPEQLIEALNVQVKLVTDINEPEEIPTISQSEWIGEKSEANPSPSVSMATLLPEPTSPSLAPSDELFSKVREILSRIKTPKTEAEVAAELQVSQSQARVWLQRLVNEGLLKKKQRPLRFFVSPERQESLFGNTQGS